MPEPASVYVVDDEVQVLKSLCVLLSARGFDVQGFSAAEEFLGTIDLFSVGCLVTDLRMPEMDGMQLQQHLVSAGSTLAVVVATGHADASVVASLLRQGAVAVLEKPYNLAEMEVAIRKALGLSQAAFSRRNPAREAR